MLACIILLAFVSAQSVVVERGFDSYRAGGFLAGLHEPWASAPQMPVAVAADCDDVCIDKAVATTKARGVFVIDGMRKLSAAEEDTEENSKREREGRPAIGPKERWAPRWGVFGLPRYRIRYRTVGSTNIGGEITFSAPFMLGQTEDLVRELAVFAQPFLAQLAKERPEVEIRAEEEVTRKLRDVAVSAFVCAWRDWAVGSEKERIDLARQRRKLGGAISNEELEVFAGVVYWARIEQKRAALYMAEHRIKARDCTSKEIKSVAGCLELAFINGQSWIPRNLPDACSEDEKLAETVRRFVGAIAEVSSIASPEFALQPNPLINPQLGE